MTHELENRISRLFVFRPQDVLLVTQGRTPLFSSQTAGAIFCAGLANGFLNSPIGELAKLYRGEKPGELSLPLGPRFVMFPRPCTSAACPLIILNPCARSQPASESLEPSSGEVIVSGAGHTDCFGSSGTGKICNFRLSQG
jgi:hypothetical protein